MKKHTTRKFTNSRSKSRSVDRLENPAEHAEVKSEDYLAGTRKWCISEDRMPRDKTTGNTRFDRVLHREEKCDCQNFYCRCGPNPALEGLEDEQEKPEKQKTFKSKPTNASILREAAILLKEDKKEQEKILELLSAPKNYADYEKYLDDLRDSLEQEALVELQRKRLSGQLSYEEAILAKKKVIEENAKKREEYLEEKATLEEELQEFRERETAKIKEMVRDVQEQHNKTKAMQMKTTKDKQRVAQTMARDLKEMIRNSFKERELEIEKKIAAIREIRILQQIKKEELNSREEQKMIKLVNETVEELKVRLDAYKKQMRQELMKKRRTIQKQKCRQEMIKTAASRFVQEVKNCREEMRKIEQPKARKELNGESPIENEHLKELRAKLEEARMRRQVSNKNMQKHE